MKISVDFSRVLLAVSLLLSVVVPAASQSSNDSPVVLEIKYENTHPEIPISKTFCIYADGRYVREEAFIEQAKSGRRRKVFSRSEKQLEPGEVAELVSWTEQPDFVNAQSEYAIAFVVDYPDFFIITHHHEDKVKTITIINFGRGNKVQQANVPSSVLKLLKWANPYYFTPWLQTDGAV
jgi:hypothetical protein